MDLPKLSSHYEIDETTIVKRDRSEHVGLFGGEAGFQEAFEKTFAPWVCVEGYDSSLPTEEIKALLTEHFNSCGRITDVYIQSHNKRYAYIYIVGVGSAFKAVKLTGTEIGGRRIVVKISHIPRNNTIRDSGLIVNTFPAYVSDSDRPMARLNPTNRGPINFSLPRQRIFYEPKNSPLPTFASGSTFPGSPKWKRCGRMTEE